MQESLYEQFIRKNISETFSAHPIFKEVNNLDLGSLCRICKAYAEYDEETGYCQVISFITATILMHVCHLVYFIIVLWLIG